MPSDTPTSAARPGLVTLQQLATDLLDAGIVTSTSLVSLLGDQRHAQSVNVLEIALVRHNVLSLQDLLARKAALAGVPAFPSPGVSAVPALPETVAVRTGALVLDRPQLTVAMVEPAEQNVRDVAAALGRSDFTVWTTTAAHFADLCHACYRGATIASATPAPDLYTVLDRALECRASDVHLKVGVSPRLRVDGSFIHMSCRPLDQVWMRTAVAAVATPRHMADLDRKMSTDLAFLFGSTRFRVNVARDAEGLTMVLRRLPTALPTADELRLPAPIRAFAHLERGLVLVTGPTGSGKSTTLAAVLSEIIHTSSRHVITLEDPIEFKLPTDRASLVNQRELGSSFTSFPEGIRDALRQDPDVMLVGEMRDQETTRAALDLADSGHLVLATLHTIDAPSTVQRVVGFFPADEQESVRVKLSQLLKGTVSQTLLPRASGKGRTAAFEIMTSSPAVSTNLRKIDGATQLKQTMQTSSREGMCTMEMSLARLVQDGVVTRNEAQFRAPSLEEFERQLAFIARR